MTWTVWCRVRGDGDPTGQRVARLAGPKRRVTLGDYPTVSLAAAREMATKVKRQARAGVDPTATATDQVQHGPTVTALIDRYATEHLHRNLRTAKKIEQVLRLHVGSAWGGKEVANLARADLRPLPENIRVPRSMLVHDGLRTITCSRGGPGAAADVRKWTRALFQFAVEHSLITVNPFADVKNLDKQPKGNRVLDMDELRAVWRVGERMGYPWEPLIHLLLLTGNRRGEWAQARWEWLKQEQSRLEIPAEFYKAGRVHVVPLSTQAQFIISRLPKNKGPFLFSSNGGQTSISGFSKAKRRLDLMIGADESGQIQPWHIHDLRRSMATHMERIHVNPHIIEVCLGHVLKGVAGIYRHYAYIDEKAYALQQWADELHPTSYIE